MEDFEDELRQALERRPAPPGLKRRLMEKRRAQRTHRPVVLWQRLAASIVLAAVVGGGVVWRNVEERRKGEAARQQVLTALRITSRALNQMNAKLAAHGRAAQE
ncbi:MAG TPA: hypothetical protein VGE83_04030 [Terracidiphilus sp.]|jgi:uridylate kinase